MRAGWVDQSPNPLKSADPAGSITRVVIVYLVIRTELLRELDPPLEGRCTRSSTQVSEDPGKTRSPGDSRDLGLIRPALLAGDRSRPGLGEGGTEDPVPDGRAGSERGLRASL